MTGKKRPPESDDKDEASAKPSAEGASIERFKSLARKVIGVSREDIDKARRAHEKQPKRRKD